MDELKKERIAIEIIKTLRSRFESFPEDASDNRNAPFHEAFLEAFRIKIEKYVTDIPIFVSLASWMHGLNTTLGQSFFEKVAHILCDGEKKKFTNLKVTLGQQAKISEIIAGLKNKTRLPSLSKENTEIAQSKEKIFVDAPNFSADVYYEEDDNLVLIELKTVKPNSDVFKEQKNKFLYSKAALNNIHPKAKILFYLGFPFDPLNEQKIGFDKTRFMNYSVDFKKYFASEEVLLADELWDYLSQEKNTMQLILSIINKIAKPDFIEKYDFINEPKNRIVAKEKYNNILNEWFLQREVRLMKSYDQLNKLAVGNKNIQRLLSQNLFDTQHEYKETRITSLLNYRE